VPAAVISFSYRLLAASKPLEQHGFLQRQRYAMIWFDRQADVLAGDNP
jgi:hypothetical protein